LQVCRLIAVSVVIPPSLPSASPIDWTRRFSHRLKKQGSQTFLNIATLNIENINAFVKWLMILFDYLSFNNQTVKISRFLPQYFFSGNKGKISLEFFNDRNGRFLLY